MRCKELDSQKVIIMAVFHLPDETFLKVDFLKIIIFEYLVSKFSGPLSDSRCSQICSVIVSRSSIKQHKEETVRRVFPANKMYCSRRVRHVSPAIAAEKTKSKTGNPQKIYLIT